MSQGIDVVGIGNAMVDVLSSQTDDFLVQVGAVKGAMNLVDGDRSAELTALLTETTMVSGGSAANTIIGIASLGGTAGYIGRVAHDEYGDHFAADFADLGIRYTTPRAPADDPTGRCIIFVTPDGQRTLNTFLGASNGLTPDDVDMDLVRSARLVFLEGYLWDPPEAKAAMTMAAAGAADDARVALTLSDGFCVDRHRDSFLTLIENHVDVLFANEVEICSLFMTESFDDARRRARDIVELAVLTRSEKGSVLIRGDDEVVVAAEPIDHVVDSTGAGDLYASGVLYGLSRGYDLERCGRLGSIAAAEVISHVGPRPLVGLRDLVGELA